MKILKRKTGFASVLAGLKAISRSRSRCQAAGANFINAFGCNHFTFRLMKKYLLSLSICLLFAAPSFAQILWQNTYGRYNWVESISRMRPISNGGYLLAGHSVPNSPSQQPGAYTVKTNAIGDTVWTRKKLPPGFIYANATDLCEDVQGNYVLVGYGSTSNQPGSSSQAFIIKLNSNGDTLWTQRLMTPNSDGFSNIVLSNDSGYVITGKNNGMNFLFKYNPNGTLRWKKPYPYSVADTGTFIGLHKLSIGYFLFIRSHYTTRLTKAIRVDENGNELAHFFNTHWDGMARITNEPAGNFLFTIGQKLVKIDAQGDTLWSKQYKVANNYAGVKAAHPTDDGNYILLIGRYNGMDGDIGLIKVTPNGDVIKDTVFYRFGATETGRDIWLDAAGNYVVAGYTNNNGLGDPQLFMLALKKWTKTAVGIKESLPETTIQIYPNPATDYAIITGEQNFTGTFTLYNLQGQKLWQQEVNHVSEQQVPLQHLPKGIYLLRYQAKDGLQVSKRILKL